MTNAELAILSLIAEKPRHGYDIEQVIEARGMRDWTEVGFSSIYYLLKKLEQNGLVQSRMQPAEGRGPARKVYHITDQGFQEFQQAALTAIAEAEAPNTGFLLGISVLPSLPNELAMQAFYSYQVRLEQRIEALKQKIAENPYLPMHVEAMFDYSLVLGQAEHSWLLDFIQAYKES